MFCIPCKTRMVKKCRQGVVRDLKRNLVSTGTVFACPSCNHELVDDMNYPICTTDYDINQCIILNDLAKEN